MMTISRTWSLFMMREYMDSDKIYGNMEKLWDAQKQAQNTFSLDMAKACHSLIHNLIEAYTLECDASVKEIIEELSGCFHFMSDMTGGEYSKLKVYEDRLV